MTGLLSLLWSCFLGGALACGPEGYERAACGGDVRAHVPTATGQGAPAVEPWAAAQEELVPGRQRRVRIMLVGDSITAGYTDPPAWTVPFEFGYRGALYELLQAQFPDQFVFVGQSPEPWDMRFGDPTRSAQPQPDLRVLGQDGHRGYGGWGTADVASHIEQWLDEDAPDLILLMIGINDIPVESSSEPLQAEANLHEIVESIVRRRPSAVLLVAQSTPYLQPTPALDMYNAYIRDVLVPEFGDKNIAIVRLRQALLDERANGNGDGNADPALYSNGWNHPNQAGYNRIARLWLEAIQRLPVH